VQLLFQKGRNFQRRDNRRPANGGGKKLVHKRGGGDVEFKTFLSRKRSSSQERGKNWAENDPTGGEMLFSIINLSHEQNWGVDVGGSVLKEGVVSLAEGP